MVSVKVSVNDSAVQKRLSRMQTQIDKQGKVTTEQVAKLTRDNIMRFMPKDTGESRNSIGYTIVTSAKGYTSAQVGIASNRMPHPEARWNGMWFNVPLYMFEGKQALTQNFRSGNIAAMRAVPKYMAQTFRRRIEVDVSKVLK